MNRLGGMVFGYSMPRDGKALTLGGFKMRGAVLRVYLKEKEGKA